MSLIVVCGSSERFTEANQLAAASVNLSFAIRSVNIHRSELATHSYILRLTLRRYLKGYRDHVCEKCHENEER